MKHLPKSTPTEILNDPYGFTYKEMSEVIGEDKARALYTELYKQPFHKENLSISTKKVYKSSDTEKYVYELKDNRYIETVFIKRRDGGTVCVNIYLSKNGKLISRKYCNRDKLSSIDEIKGCIDTSKSKSYRFYGNGRTFIQLRQLDCSNPYSSR